MSSCFICHRIFVFTNFACPVGQFMLFIPFSVQIHTSSKPMTLNKEQAGLTTKGRNINTFIASKEFVGVIPWSKENMVAMLHATSKLVLLRDQRECQMREPVISLALLEAPKHTSATCKKTSQSDERRSSASKNSDMDSSTGSYHGSPTTNHR